MTDFTYTTDIIEILRAIRTHGGVKRHYHTHVGANGRIDSFNLLRAVRSPDTSGQLSTLKYVERYSAAL